MTTRIVYSSAPQPPFPEHSGKIFAIIGPFDSFRDKEDLQTTLEFVVKGHNSKTGYLPSALPE